MNFVQIINFYLTNVNYTEIKNYLKTHTHKNINKKY